MKNNYAKPFESGCVPAEQRNPLQSALDPRHMELTPYISWVYAYTREITAVPFVPDATLFSECPMVKAETYLDFCIQPPAHSANLWDF